MPTLMLNMKLQPAAGELEMCAHAAAQWRQGSVFWFLVREGNAPQLQECSMWKKEEEKEDRA
ncbi:hypothetical protein NQZ68_012094 [Dissostichus eleginoides]|nr:hypothetical protein NQZ68_012094 [Dissostichus eleginoides]